jgi:hypothetical protein
VTYHCINFNDRVRKVQKNYHLNVWNFSDPIVEVNAVVLHFRLAINVLIQQNIDRNKEIYPVCIFEGFIGKEVF